MIIRLSKTIGDYQLSDHLNTSEVRCTCGCGTLLLDTRAVDAFENIRAMVSKLNGFETPLRILSGYRCPKKNKSLTNAAKFSGHMSGIALDIMTPQPFSTIGFAKAIWYDHANMGVVRCGSYDGYQGMHGFVHIGVVKSRNPFARERWGDW